MNIEEVIGHVNYSVSLSHPTLIERAPNAPCQSLKVAKFLGPAAENINLQKVDSNIRKYKESRSLASKLALAEYCNALKYSRSIVLPSKNLFLPQPHALFVPRHTPKQ